MDFTMRRRFPLLLAKARQIDEAMKVLVSGKKRVTKEQIDVIVRDKIPSAKLLGSGAAKVAYQVTFDKKRILVLKVIKNLTKMAFYIEPYLRAGKSQKERNHYFLKHYWATEACILQKFAGQVDVNCIDHVRQVRKIRKKFNGILTDLRTVNLGVDIDKVKIIDAL